MLAGQLPNSLGKLLQSIGELGAMLFKHATIDQCPGVRPRKVCAQEAYQYRYALEKLGWACNWGTNSDAKRG